MSVYEITIIYEPDFDPEKEMYTYHDDFIPRVGDTVGWTEYPADITWSGTVIDVSYWVDTRNCIVRVSNIGGCG